jgi:hypothetical protein
MEFSIKSSLFDRPRRLVINKAFIEFDDKDLNSASPAKFLKHEVDSFRFGVKWIRGYQFIIGRIYCIDIKSIDGNIIKIRLKSLYKVRRSQLATKYSKIITALYDNCFDDIIHSYLSDFNNKKEIQILGVTFCEEGIYLKDRKILINWLDVGTKAYYTYYTIFSLSDPSNYRAFEYLKDWNTGILYSVSRKILNEKGLYKE